MLTIIVILLAVGVIAMGIVVIMMWGRMSQTQPSRPQKHIPSQAEADIEPPKTTEVSSKKAQELATEIQPAVMKSKIQKQKISGDARIEHVAAIYASIPGVLGAMVADRFGQTIASDSNLVLDKIALPAYFIQLLFIARNERLTVGRPKGMVIYGEGSYWVFGEIAGMPWGLWAEHEISIQEGVGLAEDFRNDLIRVLKSQYTRIW